MNDIISHARRKRDLALAEVSRWDTFLAQCEELKIEAEAFLEQAIPEEQTRKPKQSGNGFLVGGIGDPPIQPIERSLTKEGVLQATEKAAMEIIELNGFNPVSTKEMLEFLPDYQIDIGGLDPSSTLSARLSRSPNLVNERGVGWRIRRRRAVLNEAADPSSTGESAASNPNNAVKRGEVVHDNMTT